MKIEKNINPLPTSQLNDSRAATAQKSNPHSSLPQTTGTSVSLGSTAAQLRSMSEGMSSGTPPINSTKVAEIKQAISEGRFKVNSEVVADRLIATVRELIDSRN